VSKDEKFRLETVEICYYFRLGGILGVSFSLFVICKREQAYDSKFNFPLVPQIYGN
jgi:hypothetical protein